MSMLVIVAIVTISFWLYCKTYKKHSFDGVSYDCYFNDVEVYQGDNILFIEEVSNSKYLPMPWLKTELTTSKYLEFSEKCSAITHNTRFVSSCYTLPANKTIRREWNISASKRGVFSIDSVVLTSCDLLGINETSMPIKNVSTKITVLPLEIDTPELNHSIMGLVGDFQTKKNLLTDVFTMRGVKEYTGHERLNRIHWKSSAKISQVMTIEEDYTLSMDTIVYLYLDDHCEESLAEKTLSTACTIAVRLSEKNVPVRLDTNCGRNTKTSFGSVHSLNIKRFCAELDLSPKDYNVPQSNENSLMIVVTPMKNRDLFKSINDERLILVRL